MSSGRSADANPLEAIAYEIVDDMTQYKLASNPVEYYLKVNKLGQGYEPNIVMPPPPQPEEGGRTRGVGRGRGRNARERVRPWPSALSAYEQQLRVDHLREERIRYILGLVTGLLVRKGHMSSAQTYRLNTARMRERIGVMVDEITSHQPPESESEQSDDEYDASQKNRLARFIERVSSASASTKSPGSIVTLGSEPSSSPSRTSHAPVPGPSHMQPQPQTQRAQARFRIDGRAPPLPKAAISFTTKQLLDKMKLMTAPDRFGKIPNFMEQTMRRRVRDLPERFQKKVYLPGFGDEDITFHMIDQHLTIKALGPKSESPKGPVPYAYHKESYVFEETIEIPPGLGLANLAITRQKDGSLLIEEAPPNLSSLVRERRQNHDAGAGAGRTDGKSII